MIHDGDILEFYYEGKEYICPVQALWDDLYVPIDGGVVVISQIYIRRILSKKIFDKESIPFAELGKEN